MHLIWRMNLYCLPHSFLLLSQITHERDILNIFTVMPWGYKITNLFLIFWQNIFGGNLKLMPKFHLKCNLNHSFENIRNTLKLWFQCKLRAHLKCPFWRCSMMHLIIGGHQYTDVCLKCLFKTSVLCRQSLKYVFYIQPFILLQLTSVTIFPLHMLSTLFLSYFVTT